MKKTVLALSVALGLVYQSAEAVELSGQIHAGEESGSVGYQFTLSDSFDNQGVYRWAIAYSYLDELEANWSYTNEGVPEVQIDYFDNDSIDLMLGYRYNPKSFNRFWRNFSFDFMAGVAIAQTDNSFLLQSGDEAILSESGDVNAVLSATGRYKLSKQVHLEFGYKIYPDYSEFEDVNSVFLGINYNFGRSYGY